ncbi:hypothetical protein N9Q58_01615 [Polaribacter sp.]|nr:hypothetical protein [Polaribacter sp.]
MFLITQGRQIAYGSGKIYQLVQNALNNGVLRYLTALNSNNCRATNNSLLTPTN